VFIVLLCFARLVLSIIHMDTDYTKVINFYEYDVGYF